MAPGVDWTAILAIAVGMKQVRRLGGWVLVTKVGLVLLVGRRVGPCPSRWEGRRVGGAGLIVGLTVGSLACG